MQPLRLRLHAVEDAAGLVQDRGALRVGVALAEQLLEHRARIAFLRQRLRRRAPRQPRAPLRRRQLQRRQPRVLADVPRRHLVGGDARIGTGDAVVPRLDATEPRATRCTRAAPASRPACSAGRRRSSGARGTPRAARESRDNSKSLPDCSGDQRSMMAPCGKPTKANRFGAAPAGVAPTRWLRGSSHRAAAARCAAPTPCSTVRRERCFFVMNMPLSSRRHRDLRPRRCVQLSLLRTFRAVTGVAAALLPRRRSDDCRRDRVCGACASGTARS